MRKPYLLHLVVFVAVVSPIWADVLKDTQIRPFGDVDTEHGKFGPLDWTNILEDTQIRPLGDTERGKFGPVDFEGYFPDSEAGARELEKLWNDPKKDAKGPDLIIKTVRNGLRRYKGDGNILRWVGNLYIEGQDPQNEKAIELMYHASESPNSNLYGNAVFSGLSVTTNKTPEILRAMVYAGVRTGDYQVLARILWGCKDQKDQLIAYLNPYLDHEDEAVRKRANDVKSFFTDSKAYMAGLNKKLEQTARKEQDGKFGPVDFEGYFPDSEAGAKQLETLWNNPKKDTKKPNFIIKTVRNGLKRYKGNGNILRWVGNLYIEGQDPQNEKAIELMYHASGSPNRNLYGNAVFSGLSVSTNKTPEILRAMVYAGVRTGDYQVLSRILWGCKDQKDQLIACLDPYLNSKDEAIRKRANDVQSFFTDSKAYMAGLNKKLEQTARKEQDGKFGPVDFEGYFPGSEADAKELEKLWNDPKKDTKEPYLIIKTVRNGLRRYKGDGNILQWVGNLYIAGQNPQNEKAIELMYHASGSPNRNLYGNAVFSGLSVTTNKTPEILRAMAHVAMKTGDYNVTARILWGCKDQKDQLIACLDPYLNSKDEAVRKRAAEVKSFLTDSKAFMVERAKKIDEAVRKEHSGKLGEYRKSLLTGDSGTRMETLTLLQDKGVMAIIDESFLDAFEACVKDPDAQVRINAARMIGQKFIWGADPQNTHAIEMLIPLLGDQDVRGTAVYYGLSTVSKPGKELLTKTLTTILDYRQVNYYTRVIGGARRNEQACIEILTEWMNQPQDTQKAVRAYEIFEDVTGQTLDKDIARRFAGKKSDIHEGLAAMVISSKPIDKETLTKQFVDCLTANRLLTKVSGFYIIGRPQNAAGMFICDNLTDRNAIRQALKDGPGFTVAGYFEGNIGPSGGGWIKSLKEFKKQGEAYRIELAVSR